MERKLVNRSFIYWLQIVLMVVIGAAGTFACVFTVRNHTHVGGNQMQELIRSLAFPVAIPCLLIAVIWYFLRAKYTVIRRGDRVRINGAWYDVTDILDLRRWYTGTRWQRSEVLLTIRAKGGKGKNIDCPGLDNFWALRDKYHYYPPFVRLVRDLVGLPGIGPESGDLDGAAPTHQDLVTSGRTMITWMMW